VAAVSVVIPAWNEADSIALAIDRARDAGADEVIVADGQSGDATVQIARSRPCRVIVAPRGRGSQQNAGAKIATGDLLLFLHADSWLPPGAIEQVRAAAVDPRVRFGAFQQRIDAARWPYRLLERGNNLRARRLCRPYGDQGIFVRRAAFDAVGGFPLVRFLEDLLLVRRLARDSRPKILAGPIHTSPRRWEKNGILRQTARNWLVLAAHHLGVPPDRLAEYW
jgi:rSAM/selenodomain-associated transferase 2